MSNVAELQEQSVQYINNVREGHQALIRRYLKDYRAILDETEMNVKDLNNAKARKKDLINYYRLKNFFGEIKQRYVNRTKSLNDQFIQDVNDSCKNAERQIQSVFPSANQKAAAKSPFALMNFEEEPETENNPQFLKIETALDAKESQVAQLAKKCSFVSNAYIGICVLVAFIELIIVGVAFESVSGFLGAVLTIFLTPGIILFLRIGGMKITTNLYTSYAEEFTNYFSTNKEMLVSEYQDALKQYVKETEKAYMVKFQDVVEKATVLLEEGQ
jgi:hypothetical protein